VKNFADLDRSDRKILHELQNDGRLTNTALAARVNLSESACLRRTRNLEASGIIRGYVGLVDQARAGYPDDVLVQITLHSQQRDDLLAFEQAVRHVPEVMECYLTSGEADYLLRVIVRDAADYTSDHFHEEIAVKGCGGTDLRPGFQWLDEQGIQPTVCLYFTDMECSSYPKTDPAFGTIWVNWGTPPSERNREPGGKPIDIAS